MASVSTLKIVVNRADFDILVAVFTGVPAADDPPADFGDDIGPLVDFDLFPNRERADELEENGGVEVTFRQFQQVLLNIGFIAADGDEGTLFPAGDIARNDADPFVFNPNVSPLDDVATNDIRRFWYTTLQDRWGLTLGSFYRLLDRV